MAEGIRKKGATYSYRINVKDENGIWKNIEKGGFKTQAEAKAARAAKLTEINTNPDNIPIKDKPIKLDEVYAEFVSKEAQFDREKSTLKRYDSLYRNHLQPQWGDRQIGTIRASELTDYFFSLSSTHAHAYIDGIYRFTKVLWKFATKRQFIRNNISSDIEMPLKGVVDDEKKIYTREQLDLFEERFSSTNLITAFKLGRALGIRCSECFGFLWGDIDWDKHTIDVTKQLVFEDRMWCLKNTKTKPSIRKIDLQDDIYNYLKELKFKQEQQEKEYGVAYKEITVAIDKGRNKPKEIKSGLPFINRKENGELLTSDSEKILGRTAREELGINFKYHNLRHTHASHLAEKSVPATIVKARLGHAKIETTMKYYTHITEGMRETLRNTLNAI